MSLFKKMNNNKAGDVGIIGMVLIFMSAMLITMVLDMFTSMLAKEYVIVPAIYYLQTYTFCGGSAEFVFLNKFLAFTNLYITIQVCNMNKRIKPDAYIIL